MKWISVKDRLPEWKGNYLVVRHDEIEIEEWIKRNGQQYWYNYFGITHWTPLPEPPKK